MTLPLISVASFGAGATITLNATYSATSFTITPTDATAQFQLQSSGDIAKTSGTNAVADVGTWIIPTSQASNYECFATLNSGTLTSGTTGSWLALTSNRTWTRHSGGGLQTAEITVQIRKIGTGLVLDSTVVTLEAEESA